MPGRLGRPGICHDAQYRQIRQANPSPRRSAAPGGYAAGTGPPPLSAYDLRSLSTERHERLYAPQVYRALNELIAQGKVLRIETLNAFCAIRQGPAAVGICQHCGQVEQIDMGDIKSALGHLFAQRGFLIDRLVVEGSGHCCQCPLPSDKGAISAP
ncbi:hypothetical protein [Sphingobium yanoikuyae]|jgi:Fur family zinc uptake transcriptional regulator|uniref:hypothetical protein n=1 Tax=Sphingobium yanoikuyae TaxID=13690 RepID=UPI00241DA9F7|nr:hypothetical protein [Sphingobium yanoikuyae]